MSPEWLTSYGPKGQESLAWALAWVDRKKQSALYGRQKTKAPINPKHNVHRRKHYGVLKTPDIRLGMLPFCGAPPDCTHIGKRPPAKGTHHVDVVSDSTDADCRTPVVICGRGEISMEILSDDRIGEIRRPVLCRKDEMKKNSRKGLRHILYLFIRMLL